MDEDLILASINQLRRLTREDVRDRWRFYPGDLPIADATNPENWSHWQPVTLDDRHYVMWSRGKRVLWLAQTLQVPPTLSGYPLLGLTLRFALRWWAEDAQIFVDGNLVQEGDLFDCFTRVLLRSIVELEAEISIALRLISPGHDDGALVTSTFIYERPESPQLDPGFIADELEVVYRQSEILENSNSQKLANLTSDLNRINFSTFPENRELFDRTLLSLHQNLVSFYPTPQLKQYLLGHAHLDMAWLWPVAETWEAAQNTFESALNLQADFPNFIFSHSTPALYAWIETHRSDLFNAIQAKVAAGTWEVAAGLWVEPELNIISGESIVRQVLYGQRYTEEKFGSVSKVAWLPDSFGFCWQLPQILKQGEVEYFVTQKLRWNDTTEFPHDLFQWQSPDGSQIVSLMSAPIGEDIDPVKMATYAFQFQTKTGLNRSLWLPGVGDHGGGPTQEMLERVDRLRTSPIFENLEFITAANYLQEIEAAATSPLPIWNDELYLEFHRGCYTTHADQKRSNRRCEQLLYQAELFSSIATLAAGVPYPKIELENAWKQVLFNQFHDILPGSAIPEVYVDADRDWRQAKQVASQLLESALQTLSRCIAFPNPPQPNAQPILVFNPLNSERSHIVAITHDNADSTCQIFDASGHPVPTQLAFNSQILFRVRSVPGIGCQGFWVGDKTPETLNIPLERGIYSHTFSDCNEILPENREVFQTDSLDPEHWVLENQFVRVKVDPETGNFTSVFDKTHRVEILASEGGNQLQAFEDRGQYWDAWNIDPNYSQHPLPELELTKIAWVERGELRSRLRVVRSLNRSRFCQDYILDLDSPLLQIETTVDWYERHILVKAAFHFNLNAEIATTEMPCGAITRPTRPQTEAERAKWEIPHLHWVDLTDENRPSDPKQYGVSLLNDCKYGCDIQPNRLRLTLLRGATWPDPQADLGTHHFTYTLYPHAGTWQEAQTVRRGCELNFPLLVRARAASLTQEKIESNLEFATTVQFLSLSAENFILMALKQAENDPDRWVVRGYECHGDTTEIELGGEINFEIEQTVNLLERSNLGIDRTDRDENKVQVLPWKIISFLLNNVNRSPK